MASNPKSKIDQPSLQGSHRHWNWLAVAGGVVAVVMVIHGIAAYRATALVNRYLARADGVMAQALASVAFARIGLWQGDVRLEDLRVTSRLASSAGDPLFHAGIITLDASWPATLRRRRLAVRRADFTDLSLWVERDAGGAWNLAALQSPSLTPESLSTQLPPEVTFRAPAPETLPPVPARPASEAWPSLDIDGLRMALVVFFRDAGRPDLPALELTYAVELVVDGFSTFPGQAASWADIRLDGHLLDEPQRARLALTGRLAPLSDPDRIDFDLTGRLSGLDSVLLQHLTGWDVTVDAAVMELVLSCRDGVFDERRSRLTVDVESLRLGSGVHRSLAGMSVARATIPIPVKGTPGDPQVAWDRALSGVLGALGTDVIEQGLERWLRRR